MLSLLEAFWRDLIILNDKAEKGNDDLDLQEIMKHHAWKGENSPWKMRNFPSRNDPKGLQLKKLWVGGVICSFRNSSSLENSRSSHQSLWARSLWINL